jgi:ankyrin repeat protein
VFFKNKWDDPDYDPTKQEIDTKVPLHIAAFKGDVEEVKRLLASGADVNEANDSGWTAIQWAARGAGKGQESPLAVEVCKLLREAGADIMSINLTGNTALHHAAHWGDPAVTDLFISWYSPEQVVSARITPCLHSELEFWKCTTVLGSIFYLFGHRLTNQRGWAGPRFTGPRKAATRRPRSDSSLPVQR